MAAIRPPLPLLAARGSFGVDLVQGQNSFKENVSLLSDDVGKTRTMAFSSDGSLFGYCNGEMLKVLNMSNGEVVFETPKQKTIEIVFSSKNKFVAIWEPFYTTPKNPQGSNNLEVFDLATGECVKSVVHKKQLFWAPQWTKDESLCARCITNEVQFFEDHNLRKATHKLYLQGVAGFSLAPVSQPPYIVAAYIEGKKGAPSAVRLFQYPNFAEGQALTNKSFFKADKVDLLWNKKGNGLLVLVSAEVDTTGSTYYGEQSLHFVSVRGDSSLVTLDKRGPIYSVSWNPNSSQFCVVFGYMPAKATLFNLKCEPVFDFGTGPRNLCQYNPHGNILCLAGFGNLQGIMEFWNVDGRKLISKPQARDTTYFEWCPDGEHFVTATCAPRLRVSNGYKIWHYSGREIHKYDVIKNVELWAVGWQNQVDGLFPTPRITMTGAVQEVKKEAYRPPGARGNPNVKKLVLHEEEAPQNVRNQENMSANALKNKKKREAKKAKQEVTQDNFQATSPTSNTQNDIEFTGDPEVDKKMKNLRKKLRQIEDLKTKQREGKQLEKNQLDKLKTENDLRRELEALQLNS